MQTGLSKQKAPLTRNLEEGLQARLDPEVQMAFIKMWVLSGTLLCLCYVSFILGVQPVEPFIPTLPQPPISCPCTTLSGNRETHLFC